MFEHLFNAFSAGGKNLYYVGGAVRDMLLCKEPKDFDFTTDALPEQTTQILEDGGWKPWPLGEKFGTVAATIDGHDIEITTHRKDMTPGRHPDVAFTDNLETDLQRRDFTINSMAMDKTGQIIDPFNGHTDLLKRVIKTTGSPASRFGEDPLRMLRAVRFVSQLGFNLNRGTRNVMYSFAHAIMSVSRERWLEEMNKLLLGEHTTKALDIMYQTRLFGYVLPEVFHITMGEVGNLPSKDLWYHTKRVIENSEPKVDVRWAALLHDIAKPQTRFETKSEVHFFQHEYLGAEMVENVARRLKMSNDMRRSIKGLVAMHQRIGDVVSRRNTPPVSKNALRRMARDCEEKGCSLDSLISLFEADCSSRKKSVRLRQKAHGELLREALKDMKAEDLRPSLPSGIGKQIMEKFDLSPGPEVGEVKRKLDQMLLDGVITQETPVDEMLSLVEEDTCT
jgi:poly(A) polymerase